MKTSRQREGREVIDLAMALVVVFAVFGCVVLLLVPSKGDRQGSVAGAARAGLLTAGGHSLLPVPDDLSVHVGQDAEGQRVEVQSVIDGEGFWVGPSRTQSVYIKYGRQIGDNASTFVPSVMAAVTQQLGYLTEPSADVPLPHPTIDEARRLAEHDPPPPATVPRSLRRNP